MGQRIREANAMTKMLPYALVVMIIAFAPQSMGATLRAFDMICSITNGPPAPKRATVSQLEAHASLMKPRHLKINLDSHSWCEQTCDEIELLKETRK
jgi:hypothetical protein